MFAPTTTFEPKFLPQADYYMPWAKGALNRNRIGCYPGGSNWIGMDDCLDTQQYRAAIRAYQSQIGKPQTSLFDAIVQNSLIRADQASGIYLSWIRAALQKAGLGPGGWNYGSIAEGLFLLQKHVMRLASPDGVPGPNTETGLIFVSQTLPHGRRLIPPPLGNRMVRKNQASSVECI